MAVLLAVLLADWTEYCEATLEFVFKFNALLPCSGGAFEMKGYSTKPNVCTSPGSPPKIAKSHTSSYLNKAGLNVRVTRGMNNARHG